MTAETIGPGLIIAGAFLDTVSTCSAILLAILLGYLITGFRETRPTIIAGLLFTASVFVMYVAMGLGFPRVRGGVTLSYAFYWIFILAALTAAPFAIRRVWHGGEASPPLQFLGAWRFAGAVLAGLLSALVLIPCTGQVYLAIISMINATAPAGNVLAVLTSGAGGYLVLYNLVYMVPLLLVVGLVAAANHVFPEGSWTRNAGMYLVLGLVLIILGIVTLVFVHSQFPIPPFLSNDLLLFGLFVEQALLWSYILYRDFL